MPDTPLLLLALLYCVLIVVLAIAALRARYRRDRGYRPSVTVVVAARNEEHNIGPCLESLLRLRYPAGLLEILVVDDHSTDRTAEIVRGYAARDPRCRLVSAGPPEPPLRGKPSALAYGLDEVRNDIVLFTDADCRVPASWAEDSVGYFADPTVGLVAGFTHLQGRGLFAGIQALDWFALFTTASGAAKIGFPLTAVGTNLCIRRSVYEQLGGFRAIPFSVTEDYALFRSVVTRTAFKVVFPMDPGTLVQSDPCADWGQLYRQKKRWFTGGRGMDAVTLTTFALLYLFHAGLLLAFAFGPLLLALKLFALKFLADCVLVAPSLSRFRIGGLLRCLPVFELFFYAYVLIFPPIVLFTRTVDWKGRAYAGSSGTS
jgi:cellulose synthase/poly-beta-1,6-N-acetylglucosamine synthase-like glycosyltransferase